jgi:hypothetical protein
MLDIGFEVFFDLLAVDKWRCRAEVAWLVRETVTPFEVRVPAVPRWLVVRGRLGIRR